MAERLAICPYTQEPCSCSAQTELNLTQTMLVSLWFNDLGIARDPSELDLNIPTCPHRPQPNLPIWIPPKPRTR